MGQLEEWRVAQAGERERGAEGAHPERKRVAVEDHLADAVLAERGVLRLPDGAHVDVLERAVDAGRRRPIDPDRVPVEHRDARERRGVEVERRPGAVARPERDPQRPRPDRAHRLVARAAGVEHAHAGGPPGMVLGEDDPGQRDRQRHAPDPPPAPRRPHRAAAPTPARTASASPTRTWNFPGWRTKCQKGTRWKAASKSGSAVSRGPRESAVPTASSGGRSTGRARGAAAAAAPGRPCRWPRARARPPRRRWPVPRSG